MSNGKLKGKVAIVTGSSSGIGAGIAVLFAKEGANLSLTGRNKDQLEKVAKECEKYGAKTVCTIGDISKVEVRESIVKNTVDKLNKVDVLVNNAGVYKKTELDEWNLQNYDLVMETNLKAVFHLTTLCVPHLTKTKGNIVNISSVASTLSNGRSTVYAMSKAALDMFTKCSAAELAKHNIRVNSVNPGLIYTNVFRTEMPNATPDEIKKLFTPFEKNHALGRAGTIDEIAKPTLFLASEDSSFMTGTITLVDGGWAIYRAN